MRTFRLVVVALALLALSLAVPAAAEERVARLVESEREITGPTKVKTATNTCDIYSEDCVFVVYTKQEIDAKLAADAKMTKALQDLVAELQKNVKVLSDANDALTKRLEDAETRLADKH